MHTAKINADNITKQKHIVVFIDFYRTIVYNTVNT